MKWPVIKIGKICERTTTRDPRQSPDVPFNYVDISSIDRELKCITSGAKIIGAEAPSRARKEIKAGDVLVSTVRPNLNAVAMVPSEYDNQIASTGFCVLRPKGKGIVKDFLYYFTLSSNFIYTLTAKVRGAHYPAVSDSDVKNVKIPLPSSTEQQRIVEILDQADRLLKLRAEADKKAKRILPALFIRMFGDPATNPMGWPQKTLIQTGAKIRYGLGQPPEKSDTGVALIRATNINHGLISSKDMIFVNPEDVPQSRDAFLRADEVLVVRSGAYTGDVAQVTMEWEGSVAGYDLVIKPGAELRAEFVEAYLLSSFIQNSYFVAHKTRAGQPHLNANQLKNTPFLVPGEWEQENFKSRVNELRTLRERNEISARKIDILFKSILHRAFMGDLTASWREAHMKELLQEMELQAKALAI